MLGLCWRKEFKYKHIPGIILKISSKYSTTPQFEKFQQQSKYSNNNKFNLNRVSSDKTFMGVTEPKITIPLKIEQTTQL